MCRPEASFRAPALVLAVALSLSPVLGDDGAPAGWLLGTGGDMKGADVALDRQVRHAGAASLRVTITPEYAGDPTGVYQTVEATDYLGMRVRLTGWVKTEDLQGQACLWMRVSGQDQRLMSLDNMSDRPITGTTDWTQYSLVLDVPVDAGLVAFGLVLTEGGGRVWLDDLALEPVDPETPLTGRPVLPPIRRTLPGKPTNLDFEAPPPGYAGAPPEGWSFEPVAEDAAAQLDLQAAHGGQASARVTLGPGFAQEFATLHQAADAAQWRGRRLRYSGWVKADLLSGWAGLWARVDGPDDRVLALDNMAGRPIRGQSEWARYGVVLDVPAEASRLLFGLLVAGRGTIWLDDVALEAVGGDVPTTKTQVERLDQPVNLDFEGPTTADGVPQGWVFPAGGAGLRFALDRQVFHGGAAAALIEVAPGSQSFAYAMQLVDAVRYSGRRVRYTGWIRAQDVEGWAGLWMRVDGPTGPMSLDNMEKRPITGTRDWERYEVVLDVPEGATGLAFGVLLTPRPGKLWVDDLSLEVVGQEVPVTGTSAPLYPRRPVNPDFEADAPGGQ